MKDDDCAASAPLAGSKKRTRVVMPAGPERNSRLRLRRWNGMAAAMADRVKRLYSDEVLKFPTWLDGKRQNEEHRPLAANALLMQEAIDGYLIKMLGTIITAVAGKRRERGEHYECCCGWI